MPTTLTTTQIKDAVRAHFEDFVNRRRVEVIRKNMAADFYDHNGPNNRPTDMKGDEEMMLHMYESMPDLKVIVEDMIAERWATVTPPRKTGTSLPLPGYKRAPATRVRGSRCKLITWTSHGRRRN